MPRMPHLVMVLDHVPNREQSTVTHETYCIATRMAAMGALVDVLYVHEKGADTEASRNWMQELNGEGIRIRTLSVKGLLRKQGLNHRVRELAAIKPESMWLVLRERHRLKSVVQSLEPDLVYVFGEYPLIFCFEGYKDPIRLIAGDPPNDSLRHAALVKLQSKDVPLKERLRAFLSLAIARNMKRLTRVQGRALPPVGFHDLREVESAKRNGWREPYFARPEIPDLGVEMWPSNTRRLRQRSSEDVLRVVMFGQLGGQATASGVPFLVDEVIPILSEELRDRVTFEIVGKGVETLPEVLVRRAMDRGVTFSGFVPDLSAHLSKCDVVLLPIPSQKGSRPRILYAWSLGIPVLALSTVLGRLEGVDDPISDGLYWTAETASGLVKLLGTVAGSQPYLADLSTASRRAFEKYYVAGALSLELAEELSLIRR